MTEANPTDPAFYRFWAAEHVRFDDLDAFRHVNNKAYLTYYETARVEYLIARGISDSHRGGTALVRLEVDYWKEIRYPAALKIGVRPIRLGNSSMTLLSAVFNGDVCASTARAIIVRYNAEARASQPISDDERRALEADL